MIYLGIVVGIIFTLLWVYKDLKRSHEYDIIRDENTLLEAQLSAERIISQNLRLQLEGLDERLTQQFKTSSLELFKENARCFVQLAENSIKQYNSETKDALNNQRILMEKLMDPLKINLDRFTTKVEQLEQERQKTDITFKDQLQQISQLQIKLENKTDFLTHAFYNPNQRGRWGEIQLKRIVEMAGMLEYVDFEMQVSINDGALRPDMVIHLPNNRCVIVDAKTPQLEDYLTSITKHQTEEIQQKTLQNCCQRIRELISKLSTKNYGTHFESSADFVVLFFPGEWIFSRALQADSTLIEHGCKNNIVFATPTTLIALLKSIHYGWRQNKMIEEVKNVEKLGSELYERMLTFGTYFNDLRKNLSKTVDSYNQLLGSLEFRMLPAAKKLNTFSKKNIDLHMPEKIETNLKI